MRARARVIGRPARVGHLALEILQLLLERARIGQRCGDLQFTCVQPLIKVGSARRPCGCL